MGTLCDILRLYYGIRCILAHGKARKTLKDGVLKNFPATDSACFHNVRKAFTAIKQAREALKSDGKLRKVSDKFEEVRSRVFLDVDQVKQSLQEALEVDCSTEVKQTLRNSLKVVEEVSTDKNWSVYKMKEKDTEDKTSSAFGYYDLYKVYDRLESYGRDVWVNYLTLIRLSRFIFRVARRLMLAIAKWLHEKLKVENVWGYDPTKTAEQMTRDEDDQEKQSDK